MWFLLYRIAVACVEGTTGFLEDTCKAVFQDQIVFKRVHMYCSVHTVCQDMWNLYVMFGVFFVCP